MNVHTFTAAVASTLLYLASVIAGALAFHDVMAFRFALLSIGLTALSYVGQLATPRGSFTLLMIWLSWLTGIAAGLLVMF